MSLPEHQLEGLRSIVDDALAWLQDPEVGRQAIDLAARRPECLRALGRAMADLVAAEQVEDAAGVEAAQIRARAAAAALRFVSDLERKGELLGGRGAEKDR